MKIYLRALIYVLVCTGGSLYAQTVTIGAGNFVSSNAFGPAATTVNAGSASRYAYIYPQSLLGNLKPGDTVSSIEFLRNGTGFVSGNISMQIYMRSTIKNDYGSGSLNWPAAISSLGMTKVYDDNPVVEIGSAEGFRTFKFSTPFVYDTTFGKNLEILVEYLQSTGQAQEVFWNYDNNAFVPAYQSNQAKFVRGIAPLTDTTTSSSDRHPCIRLNFPRYDKDLTVLKIYSLGKLPVPLGNPDTVKAIIRNVGKRDVNNAWVLLASKGANRLVDSMQVSLAKGEERLITLPILTPTRKGLDTLEVLIRDTNAMNNTMFVRRLATENIYSYRDISLPPDPGGIGFNGSTGDFVAKFYSNTSKAINQITVNFGFGGTNFRLGIWAADGPNGQPGTNVWTSNILTSQPSFITAVDPPLSVNGSFYVGVRQIGTNNVAFGYQTEDPVRPGTFFFTSPTGSSNWVDFAPDAPFKFLIEPRLQADNDVAPIAYLHPKDTIDYFTMKPMAPKVAIHNFGVNHQLTPFTVTCSVRQFGTPIYSSSVSDTISSNQTHIITFDSTLLPPVPGEYQVRIITKLGSDQVTDNDTLNATFFVARNKDVGITTVFEPSRNFSYELNVDTLYPVVRVNNFGIDNQGPFAVRAFIYDSSNNLVFSEAKNVSIPATNSTLLSFKAFPCSKTGTYRFLIYTALAGDKDRKNDTARGTFFIVKSNDVGVSAITLPAADTSIAPGSSLKPKAVLSNYGDLNQPGVKVLFDIYRGSTLVHRDSTVSSIIRGASAELTFNKLFNPTERGYYKAKAYTKFRDDQVRSNDTVSHRFAVGIPDDVKPLALADPADSGSLELNHVYAPKVSVFNAGFMPQDIPFEVRIEIRDVAGQLVYSDVRSLPLDSGSTAIVSFDSSFRPVGMADHKVLVYTSLPADFVRNNDTLRGVYHIIKTHDVAVKSIDIKDSVDFRIESIVPAVTIENLGLTAETTPFPVQVSIRNPQGAVVYSESTDSSLALSESRKIWFTGTFKAASPGLYRVMAVVTLPADQLRSNDTLYGSFEVVNRRDAAPLLMIYPAHTATIKSNIGIQAPKARIYNWGIESLDTFTTYIRIRNSALATVYSSSMRLSLLPMETRDITFDSTFDPSVPGGYIVTLWTEAGNDQRPDNDTIVTSFSISDNSSLHALEKSSNIILYPNPVSGRFTLRCLDAGTHIERVRIADMSGKSQVLPHVAGLQDTSCDITALAQGLYMVTVYLDNGSVAHVQISIQR